MAATPLKFVQKVGSGSNKVNKVVSTTTDKAFSAAGQVSSMLSVAGSIGQSVGLPVDVTSMQQAFDKQIENVQKAIAIEESITKAISDLSNLSILKDSLSNMLQNALLSNGLVASIQEAIDKIKGLSIDQIKEQLEEQQPGAVEATEDYIDSTLSPIPETDSTKYNGVTRRLHAMFSTATERILEDDSEGNLFTGIAAMAVGTIHSELSNAFDEIDNLGQNIDDGFEKLNKLFKIAKTGKGNLTEIADIFSSLPTTCNSVKGDVLNIQRLAKGSGFSDYRMQNVKNKLESIIGTLPDLKIEKSRSGNRWTDVSNACSQIKGKLNQIDNVTDNVVNLKNNFMGSAERIKPPDSTYTGIYKQLDTLSNKSKLFKSLVDKGDSRARDCYNDVKYDINRILAALSDIEKYTKNNGTGKMLGKLAKADAKIGGFLSKLDEKVIKPIGTVCDCMDTLSYTAKFAKNTADKLTSLFYNPKSMKDEEINRLAAVTPVMQERAKVATSVATNALIPALATTGSFNPGLSEATKVYMDTVKQTAPAAMDAMKKADMDSFTSTVLNPSQITTAGQIASKIQSFVAANGSSFTVQDLADISTLANMFEAQNQQELLELEMQNVSEQREAAKEEAETYEKTKLIPMKQLAQKVEEKHANV